MQGIAIFLAARFSGDVSESLHSQLARWVRKEGGVVPETRDPEQFVARFPSGTSAIRAVGRILRGLEKTEFGVRAAIGIDAAEVVPGETLQNNSGFARSCELTEIAYEGQVLLAPAARELVRPCLPAGFGLLVLGETQLGRSISAEPIVQLLMNGVPSDFPRIEALDDVRSNVRELTDFIGRDAEASRVRAALAQSQLVSITGTAGVGKSALANWIALDLAESYRDGTWHVDFGKIPVGGNVATAMAADLRLPNMPGHCAEDRVKMGLSTMQGVVWLDNCEHVLPELRDLLSRTMEFCRGVRFLAASRRRIGLEQEIVVELSAFSVPDHPEKFADSEAVRLFVNRAKRASADFVPTHETLAAVADICRKVDGLPLAIELAAAQLSKMPAAALRSHLSRALKSPSVSVAARHKTLDRALGWSYSLLSPREQRFFRNLGVLAGPACRELALAAGASEASSQDSEALLQAMLDSSLLVEDDVRGPRMYRLLAPIRQFALERLEENAEEARARSSFLRSCLAWIRKLVDARLPESRFLSAVGKSSSNLESALEWSLSNPGSSKECLRLAYELYPFWIRKGPFDHAADLLGGAIDKGKHLAGVSDGKLYNRLGLLEGYAGRFDRSDCAFRKALQVFIKEKDRRGQAMVYSNWALHTRNADKLQDALEYGRRSIDAADPDDTNLMAYLGNFATDLVDAGRLDEGRVHLMRAMEMNEVIEDPMVMGSHCFTAAMLDVAENNSVRASDNLHKSLFYYRQAGDVQGLLSAVEFAGYMAMRLGDYARAAKLFGGAEVHFLKAGVGRNIPDERRRDRALEVIGSELGAEQAEALYAFGAMMSLDELYDYARSGPDPIGESSLI